MKTNFSPKKHIQVHIGEDSVGQHRFTGKLREFSADNGNPIPLKCSKLEVLIDNSVQSEVETATRKFDGEEVKFKIADYPTI